MATSKHRNEIILEGVTHRQAARVIVSRTCDSQEMSATEMARLIGYHQTTVSRYIAGTRKPSRAFMLDLREKAGDLGIPFARVAHATGLRWNASLDPLRHSRHPFAEYISTVRVAAGRTREQFAAKLNVSLETIVEVEHGVIPELDLVHRMARKCLPEGVRADDVITAFAVLRPTPQDLDIRSRLAVTQSMPLDDPRRRRLEDDFAREFAVTAAAMARTAAWRVQRPELADEVWGEGLFLAMRHRDARRGFFLPYLRARIRGLVATAVRESRQTGINRLISDYGPSIRAADEFLISHLHRFPTDDEVAQHTDLPISLIGEVRKAIANSHPVSSDSLEFLLSHAVEISPGNELYIVDDKSTYTRLRELPELWREMLYLHYDDKKSVSQIAQRLTLSEESVTQNLEFALSILRADRVKIEEITRPRLLLRR